MITETASYCAAISEERTRRAKTSPVPPASTPVVPRLPGIGDALAAARTSLIQRIEEACETIRPVLAERPSDFPALPPTPDDSTALGEHADFLLDRYLDPFMRLVFNGEASVRLAVSGKRLKKVSRRLHDAVEEFDHACAPLADLAGTLSSEHPGFAPTTYERTAAALLVLAAWDASPAAPTATRTRSLLRSIERDGHVRLALFVCPPVDFTKINSVQPELYVRDHMHGSVLSRLTARLRELFRGLEDARVDVDLWTIIGDTDEDDYLWYGVDAPAHLDRLALDERREALVGAVARYLTEEIPRAGGNSPRVFDGRNLTVQRLSGLAPSTACRQVYASVLEAPLHRFEPQDIEAEKKIMRGLWKPNSYYQGLPEPDDTTLTSIVVRKFATYAMQGRLLRECEPDLVLIQTERPSLLRARMLSAGWDETGQDPLPTVDFFEPEES
ncbi:hypothetical protein [Streptomyces xanthochromogenes]|uniref:hypothetical protein n=1 Tax=Streptomyces xanthochromogenes TaxID=67384 RepID=UPI001424650E